MDWDKISADTLTSENYTKYLDTIDSYLDECRGKTVLELGPCNWMMSERILSKNPISLDTIEPDLNAHKIMPEGLTNHLMTANDFFAKDKRTFDVVICTGVMYHLHSPIHLLEQIINIAKPKQFILETTRNTALSVRISLNKEKFNIIGNAHSDKGIDKPIEYSLNLPNKYYEDIILEHGYEILCKEYIEETHRSKCDVYIWHFIRK
jgi:hypothetical protein|tara:strand:- start:3997 stop:4617 length:621 start_codon:yes stop_codon:yes gene_type:complete